MVCFVSTNNTGKTISTWRAILNLSFHQNKFVLQGVNIGPADWERESPSAFSTTNIKAAARFRSHADSKAEMIFNKLMLKTIALPAGGVLQPKGMDLYDFQKNFGVPHILGGSKTYLAHEPGLGKSAQSICAVNSKPGRTLLIVPSFLRITWAREITKWSMPDFPSIAVVPVSTKQALTNWAADFVIVPDSMLAKPWVISGLLKQNFRFVFIDEGHRFKTKEASRTVALFGGQTKKLKSSGLIYRAEHVSILSGTPLLNRPIELWPMLYAMAPELIDFMSYQDFGFHFGGAFQDSRGHWHFTGSANEQELKNRIMGRFMQRITKKQVLKDLPDKVREVIVIDRDGRASDVKAMDQELMRKLRRSDFEKPKELGDYAKVRHQNGLAKVQWVADFVDGILENDLTEQVILFAHHRDVVEGLCKALAIWLPRFINGGVSIEMRTQIEDEFQKGARRLIVGNIDAMNLGLTLTAATRVVFAEYAWTPALNEQAEDRAHRIGQKDSIFCQYLVLPNSIDEVILNSVMQKETKISKVMGI